MPSAGPVVRLLYRVAYIIRRIFWILVAVGLIMGTGIPFVLLHC